MLAGAEYRVAAIDLSVVMIGKTKAVVKLNGTICRKGKCFFDLIFGHAHRDIFETLDSLLFPY